MSTAHEIALPTIWTADRDCDHLRIMSLTARAFEVAKTAMGYTADALGTYSKQSLQVVLECEKQLDELDREIDEHISSAVSLAATAKTRELLACLKCTIDLERIGDLLCSLLDIYTATHSKVEMQDINELIRMACAIEKMLRDVHHAFIHRDADASFSVVRADSEVDRFRNLIFMRHLETRDSYASSSIHVLLMAQALERTGDHTKNLAEEVCHLVSGHSMRHFAQQREESYEQMYLRWLRESRSTVSM